MEPPRVESTQENGSAHRRRQDVFSECKSRLDFTSNASNSLTALCRRIIPQLDLMFT